MSDQPADFEVWRQRIARAAMVRVVGKLGVATTPQRADVLDGLKSPCDRVVLDVSALTFIDSAGLRLAVGAVQRANANGFEFVLAGADGQVSRVQRLTGLDVTLPMAPTVATALGDTATDGYQQSLRCEAAR
jgi:anti-anti-sigma factor